MSILAFKLTLMALVFLSSLSIVGGSSKKVKIGRGIKKKRKSTEQENLEQKVRSIEELERDWFGLPEDQAFPHDEYFVKSNAVVGVISSGKSTFEKRYVANKLDTEWGKDKVMHVVAQDLWATIQAVTLESNKPITERKQIFHIIIDDATPFFDARRSMDSSHINLTQFYYEIRHELKKHAEASGGNAGGLVFISIIVQDFSALDVRLRRAVGLIIFKSWDDAIKARKIEPKIVRILKKVKYKVSVACNKKYRQYAVIIDSEDKYTLFQKDLDQFPSVHFEYITGEDIYAKQVDDLVDYLNDNFEVLEEKRWFMKGKLTKRIKEMKKEGIHPRVSKSDFTDIILLAKTNAEDLERKTRKDLNALLIFQKKYLIAYLIYHHDVLNDETWYLEGKMYDFIEKIKQSGVQILVNKSQFAEIMKRAKTESLDQERENNQNSEVKIPNDLYSINQPLNGLILVLKDIHNISLRNIAKMLGLTYYETRERYHREKKDVENVIVALKNNDLKARI